MINDTTRPLIFLGSNHNLHWLSDAAQRAGITVAGVIDDDYHGQGHFQDIPILATEQQLLDNINSYQTHQFFCATNWQPAESRDPYQQRNQLKRQKYIDIMESHQLAVATIVHPSANICSYKTHIGKGVFIDNFCYMASNSSIGNYSMLYAYSGIADFCSVGNNCVIQRQVVLTGRVTVGNNVYLAVGCRINKQDIHIADGTFVQQGIQLLRSTQPGEVISLAGRDLRRVYYNPTES